MKITIPASPKEAIKRLNGLGALLNSQGWERAAIVYAWTVDQQGSNQHQSKVTDARFGINEFAALGIVGLKSHNTVQTYRRFWAEYGNAPGIKPGDTVDPPTEDFPTQSKNDGSRLSSDPKKAVEQIMAKPKPVQEAVVAELLKNPKGRQTVEDKLADSPAAVARINQKAETKRPTPARQVSQRNRLSAVVSLTDLEVAVINLKKVRAELEAAAEEVVSDILEGTVTPELIKDLITTSEEQIEGLQISIEQLKAVSTGNETWDALITKGR